jgi:AcrR family transcriptional regulator
MHVRPPPRSLRERKKVRTRADIQRQALRLFREHGYEATTVSQIAAAAEVSESTFFRYFPTKEDVVLWDAFDPLILDALRRQPPELAPVAALRAAFREVLAPLPVAERASLRERLAHVLSIPPVHAAGANRFGGPLRQLAEVIAERVGRTPDDFAVHTLLGAVAGVCLAVLPRVAEDPEADVVLLLDQAVAHLEAGLRL